MGNNIASQGVVISFKGDLSALKSAASQAKTIIQDVGNAAKPAGSNISSSFKSAASSIQNFSSSAQLAGENTNKLASLQAKAGEAAARLQVAQANAANALKRATDMENSGKASAEQLAVAQSKAALAAQQVQTKETALATATQKVTNEEKSLASAMQEDGRETVTFAKGLDVVKGVLGTIGSGLKSAVSGLMEFGSKALSSGSEASEGMQKATTSVERFKSESSNMHVSFVAGVKSMASGLMELVTNIGFAIMGIQTIISTSEGLAKALLAPAASAEQTQVAFTGLLGSAQKATSFLQDLRKFAATTPFEFPELAAASRKMLSFGFATRDVIPMMTRLGDAVATMGGSSDEIDRAVNAIGQMHAKTKVAADEMNQLTDLGIPAWDMLAKSMGKTTAQVMDMVSKGLIPADQGIDALMKGMERFKGGMDAQSKTFMGLLSNLKDGATMALMAFGGPILDSAKKGLGDLVNLVSSPAFEKFAGDVGKRIATVIDDIGKASTKVKDSFDSFKKSIDKVSASSFAKGIGYLASQFGFLYTVISGKVKSAFSSLKDAFMQNTTLSGLASAALGKLGNFFHSVGEKVKEFAKSLKSFSFSNLFGTDQLEYFISDVKILGQRLGTVFELIKITGIKIFDKIKDSMKGVTSEVQKIVDRITGFDKLGDKVQKLGGVFGLLNIAAIWAGNEVYKLGNFLQSPGFQKFADGVGKNISDVFKTIGDIVNNKVKPAFDGVKKTLESPTFETFKNTMWNLFTAVGGLAGSVFNLWTQLSPLGALFSGNTDVGKKFSDVLSTISNIINTYVIPGINGLSKWITDMGPIIAPIEAQLSGMFAGIWKWFQDNGPTLMKVGGEIFTAIGDTIKEVGPIISKDLLPALSNLGTTVGPIISDFIKWEDKTGGVEAGLGFLKQGIKNAVTTITDIINVVTWCISVWQWWNNMCTTVGTALGTILKAALDIQTQLYNAITKPFTDAWGSIQQVFGWITNGINNLTGQGNTVKANTTNIMTGQHHFAGGVENFKGGMAVVGEKGPELVRLGKGSDVYTASETKAMLSGMKNYSPSTSNYTKLSSASGGGYAAPVIHNHITVVMPAPQVDGRDLATTIGPHVGEYVAYEMARKGRL